MLIRGRLPRDGADTIEAKQAEFCTQPEIAVRRLRNRDNLAFNEPVADLPSRVGVLADVERGVQPERERTHRQQHASQHNPQSDNGSCSSVRSQHSAQYCLIVVWASETRSWSNARSAFLSPWPGRN